MGYEERSNKLPESQMRSEYVVHGHFLLSRNDQNAKPNAFWVSLNKMIKDVGIEAVKLEIDIFTDQAEAVIQMELEEHEKDQSDGDESDHGAEGSA